MVGVHWPLDVAVGGLIGWVTAVMGTWVSYRIPISSNPMSHRLIALLPGLAAVVLLTREPPSPEIAPFEVIVGVVCLLLTVNGLWRTYGLLRYWEIQLENKSGSKLGK